MPITTLSSRQFNQDRGRAKKAARSGPVFITDRGRPSMVLLSIEEYDRLANKGKSMGDMLACPDAAEIDFDPPKMNLTLSAGNLD